MRESKKQKSSEKRSIPAGVIALVVLLETGFQTMQFVDQRALLDQAWNSQRGPIVEVGSIPAEFSSIIGGTLALADHGHPGVQAIVDRMNLNRFRGKTP